MRRGSRWNGGTWAVSSCSSSASPSAARGWPLSSLFESLLGDLFSNRISVRLMEARGDARPGPVRGLGDLRSSGARAPPDPWGGSGFVALLLSTAQDPRHLDLARGGAAVQLPWLLLLLVVAVVPSFLGETHYAALGYSLLFQWTPERRLLDYLR